MIPTGNSLTRKSEWTVHMWKSSFSQAIHSIQTMSVRTWNMHTDWQEWNKHKYRELGISCTGGGRPIPGSWRAVWQFLAKLRIFIPFDSEIPLLGVYSEMLHHTNTHESTHENVSCSTIYKIKPGEQPKCALTGSIHLMGQLYKLRVWHRASHTSTVKSQKQC